MNTNDWAWQLDRLRQGKLRLTPPGESGLGEYSSTSLYELRRYVAALEAGYREVCLRLDGYRIRGGGKTVGELVKNQWSAGACLGYAAMALIQVGETPDQTVAYLELMEEFMEEFGLEAAAEFQQRLKDGENVFPGAPEWVGPSAELLRKEDVTKC